MVSRFGAIDAIQRTVTTSFLEALLDGLVMLITLVLMFLYSPPLAWIAVGAMALYGLARWSGYAPLHYATEEHIVHAAKEQSHFLETVRGVKAIKLFQHQDDRRSRWLSLLVNEINADLRVQKWTLFFRTFNGLLFGLSSIAILWLGARLVLDGQFTVGALLAFIVYKTLFDQRVAALLDKLVEVKMLRLQGERLADIVRETPEPVDERLPVQDEHPRSPVIEVRNLRFRYGPQEPYVLDDISFRIEPGESVAITGPSGGGKTTLINILLGVLTPTDGEVLIDGVPARGAGAAACAESPARYCRTTSSSPDPSARTSASSIRNTTLTAPAAAPQSPRSTTTSAPCPWATTRWWETWARCCRAARSSGCCWRGRCTSSPPSCSWTRPPATWTLSANGSSTRPSPGST